MPQAAAAKSFAATADLQGSGFGQHVFKGEVATKYLSKYGENASLLATGAWTEKKADVVAAAILDWATDNGASVYCHWCALRASCVSGEALCDALLLCARLALRNRS